MVPWEQGKYLVWDVTCIDNFVNHTPGELPLSQEGLPLILKRKRPRSMLTSTASIDSSHIAMETCGSIGPKSRAFLGKLSKRLNMVTGEPKSHAFLMQRISVAIQVGNATSVIASLSISVAVNIDFMV